MQHHYREWVGERVAANRTDAARRSHQNIVATIIVNSGDIPHEQNPKRSESLDFHRNAFRLRDGSIPGTGRCDWTRQHRP